MYIKKKIKIYTSEKRRESYNKSNRFLNYVFIYTFVCNKNTRCRLQFKTRIETRKFLYDTCNIFLYIRVIYNIQIIE